MKRVFVTGVTGYIGGSVAHRLLRDGFEVSGLFRRREDAARLESAGVRPIEGNLEDAALLTRIAGDVDIVINAADSDHRSVVEALISGLRGTGKTLVHTSGSSIVADHAGGEPADRISDEESRPEPVPEKVARVAIDKLVVDAAGEGIRSVVVCPPMIYGRGTGIKRDSIQVPMLIGLSKERRAGVHIGRGLNRWSNVHIEDLADLYALVVERAPAGAFYFAENGEDSLHDIAVAISRALGSGGETFAWPVEEAVKRLGVEGGLLGLASNSRIRAVRARKELGWSPSRGSLLDEIETGSYRADFGA
jgi:nucleoside-diphosphate-sugar epimerase